MSDAAVTTIVTGVIQVTGMVIGFLTLWLRQRATQSKAEAIEKKVEENTDLTAQTKDTASSAKAHTDECREGLAMLTKTSLEHGGRIAALEATAGNTSRELSQTRHEMRGHLQTITNQLGILMAKPVIQAPAPAAAPDPPRP